MRYRQLDEQGKLALGGPFLTPDMGGMLVTQREVPREENEVFAAADPAVVSGLLRFEIRLSHTPVEPD